MIQNTVTVRELNTYAIMLERKKCVLKAKEIRQRVLALVALGKTKVCLDADPEFASRVKAANYMVCADTENTRRLIERNEHGFQRRN